MDNRAMKIGIISGIVSSLIMIIFIQPILSFIWNAIVGVGGTIQQGYVDRIYRNAALADRNLIGHMAFLILFFFLQFGSITLLMRSMLSDPRFAAHARWFRIGSAIGGVVLSVVLLIGFSISAGIMEISTSFTQRLTVLAPAITDSEYKTLRAQWASMRGEADYEAILAEMNKRATELGITLPPVRKP
jgi:hypothetical protein